VVRLRISFGKRTPGKPFAGNHFSSAHVRHTEAEFAFPHRYSLILDSTPFGLRESRLVFRNHTSRAISALLPQSFSLLRKKSCVSAKLCYVSGPMAILKKNAFSRRVPDLVTEELVAVLSRRASFEFKQLFDIVHENLRARNAASGGEEMLRLRAYEKLQNLVARGAVKKSGKKYKGLPSALANAIAPPNGHLAGVK